MGLVQKPPKKFGALHRLLGKIPRPFCYRGTHWWCDLGWYKGELFTLFEIELFQFWGKGNFMIFHIKIAQFCFGIGRG